VTLEEEVQDHVARLLAMVTTADTDPESYEFVLKELTRMSILGTRPRGSGPSTINWSYKSEPADDDDFSAKKENFIAP
jgi:hypothetical protein